MKFNKSKIRRSAKRYLKWLQDRQWFQLEVSNKEEWTLPIVNIISKVADCPESLWEAVVDHWQAAPWREDGFPKAFEELYDFVDEYRVSKHIDSSQQKAA